MRVVLDTNVAISALVHRGKMTLAVIGEVCGRHCWLCSLQLAVEYGAVISREKFSRVAGATALKRALQRLVVAAEPVVAAIAIRTLVDEDDNRVLECAAAGCAAVIVSGDRHLLELRSFQGITIVTPAAFLALSEAAATE